MNVSDVIKLEREEEKEKPVVFDVASLDTYVLLRLFINILGAKAWQNMGLRVKPGMDEVEKDMGRAKIAIDSIAFLIDRLEPHIQEDERSSLRNLLADLQINFARQST